MGKLDGKVAVITGSGRGVGKAIASLFAQEGASVVINDIDPVPAGEAVKEIEAKGGKATACVADITKPDQAQNLMDTAAEKFGKLDILVNNAGITRDALIHKMTDAQWDMIINIMLKGSFNCVRAASKYMMKESHNGRIINISSVAGLMGNIGQINYSSAKAGLIGMTKTIAKEWQRFGVTCNAVAYGIVDTRLTKEKETGEEVEGEKVGVPKKVRDVMVQQMGGAIMQPEDAAKPVLFLASDDARFLSGNVLNVSGGMYM
jgi:Dehydrogenases with different specificities (related to short-chain alcohol dehydrogenases)